MKIFTKYINFILVFFLFTTSYVSAQDSSKYNMYVGFGNVNFEFGMKYQFNSVESQFGIKGPFAWGLESNVFFSLLKTSHFRHQIGLSGELCIIIWNQKVVYSNSLKEHLINKKKKLFLFILDLSTS